MRESIEKLRKPLAAEVKLGYANTAVIGGLAEYMLAHTQRALDALELGRDAVAEPLRAGLTQLQSLWQNYAEAPLAIRERLVHQSQELLEAMKNALPEHHLMAPNEPAGIAAPSALTPCPSSNPSTGWNPSRKGRGELSASAIPNPESQTADPQAPIQNPKSAIRNREIQNPKSKIQNLATELTYLKGIGPRRAEALAKLGLRTVYDLLYYFPARYEDRRQIKQIAEVTIGAKESLCVTVLFPAQTRAVGGRMGQRSVTRLRVGDASGRADLQWWNQPFREAQFKPGMQLFVYGKVTEFGGMLQIETPDFEVMGENDNLQVGRIVPVYGATEGLFQSNLRRAMATALERCGDGVEEMLPEPLRRRFDFRELSWCLRQIHFPDTWEAQEQARARLLFEELFLLQVALAQKRLAVRVEEIGVRHLVEEEQIKSFLSALPFKLTGAQKRVMNEVRRDLRGGHAMNRLLHGDVGSGKTIVAAYALWSAHVTGRQGALLAPTEILAEQHFSVLTRLFKPLGIEVALLEGSLKAAQKRRIQADLNEGRVSIVVGTHALIQEGVEFKKLSVCVVDEQHRFGVMQRAALQHKGPEGLKPDVLVMTATPIPRTMALTVYGDLEVSTLDELPPGRQEVKTVVIKPLQRERAYKFVLDEVKRGRQAFVVCPLVEESEKLAQLKAATALAERLRAQELNGLRVGLLHGQMAVVDRDNEMELFRAGMLDVLVSTTVIEVGVDVPNATVMLVEDAERFGLSQLHQLRGRVGRGQFKSTCVLLGAPSNDEARARLTVMKKTSDGFEIAERDLQLRGPGEFYGTRQSGLPDFRLANIIRDVKVIETARELAIELVRDDPHLQQPEHQPLQQALKRFWGDKLSLVQVS